MKRFVLLLLTLMVFPYASLADPMTIDLDTMLPSEIDALIEMASKEKREATDFSSEAYDVLKVAFEQAFESMFPSNAEASYPLFGLSKERSREMYMLSGDVTIKYADKSKQKFSNVTSIHFLDAGVYNLVAFFSDEQIYYFDETYYSKASPYISEAIKAKLNPSGLALTGNNSFDPVEAQLVQYIKKYGLTDECKTVIMEYLPDFRDFDRMEQDGLRAFDIIMKDGTVYYLIIMEDKTPACLMSSEEDYDSRTRYYDKFAK